MWVPCCTSDLQNLKLELWEERLRKKGILWLIRIVIWQKPTQNCKAIFYQLKKKQTGNLYSLTNFVIAVQSLSCVWLFATLWTAVCQASLHSTISRSLLSFMSTESVLSNHLILLTNLLSVNTKLVVVSFFKHLGTVIEIKLQSLQRQLSLMTCKL